MDAYSPIPIEELNEALDLKRTRLPQLVLLGGILGGLGGFSLEYWSSVMAYPMNIGDRPLNSWPQFIPVTFETTVLGAALTAVCRHVGVEQAAAAVSPGFQRAAFGRASTDRFFLSSRRRTRDSSSCDVEVSRRASSRRSVRSCAVSFASLGFEALGFVVASELHAGASCARALPAAARTCTMHRATSRSRPARSSTTAVRRGRWSPTLFRAGICARTSSLHGDRRRQVGQHVPDGGDRGRHGAWTGALQRVLLALPRPHRRGQRHDRSARIPTAAIVP